MRALRSLVNLAQIVAVFAAAAMLVDHVRDDLGKRAERGALRRAEASRSRGVVSWFGVSEWSRSLS
jgi:hypothetical protein